MSLVAMAFLWTGSQIPVYLFGGIPPYIYGDIGGTDRWIWFVCGANLSVDTDTHHHKVLANLLALAAVCPFVGSLSDLLGRRYVALLGAILVIIGLIVSSTANDMNIFIGRQKCPVLVSSIGPSDREQLEWLLREQERGSTS